MVKKIDFEKLTVISAEELFYGTHQKIMDLSDYKHLERKNLIKYNLNKVGKLLHLDETISFCLRINDSLKGTVVLTKDLFDSDIFGFSVYRFQYLIIKSDDVCEIEDCLRLIISEVDRLLKVKSKSYYILFSLNSNFEHSPLFLSQLLKNGYYYIQTLLTFGMTKADFKNFSPERNKLIKVRDFQQSDLVAVCELAKNSFKLSRFHLDPNLNNDKSNILLETSARNSILNKFADVVYVAEYKNKIIGYYSAKKRLIEELDVIFGEAIISAVNEESRGLGIFKHLNQNMLEWFYNNTDLAEMGTYLINYPVHRTWIQNKLKLVRGIHQVAKFVKNY